jgi:N-acetylneuraminate synthase/N,N'-diacetyllegionaminate synthase
VLALIPARGGSKGIPRKNLTPLLGRPLIAWTIDAARRARSVQRVVVSTDDDEIAEAALAAGAEVPMRRPAALASDTTPGIDPVLHAVSWLEEHEGYRPEFVLILQPTSPLRTADDIDAAAGELRRRQADALVSVSRMGHPLAWTSRLSADGVLVDFHGEHREETDRQSAEERFVQNGAIYIVRRELLVERRTLYAERTLAYVMPAERSLDLDEAWEIAVAEALLRERRPASIAVGSRRIGPGAPCFVIAEIGVNHNGRPDLAAQLIDAAADAGADAVKLQTWDTDALVTADAPLADYQRQAGGPSTQYALLKSLELPADALGALKARARSRGLEFFSTPDDEASADLLERLGVALFKIGSGELTNLALLRRVAAIGRPMIVSTGMATLAEVGAAVRAIEDAGSPPLVLLHCVSTYPSRPDETNLRAMDTLAAFGCPVGFSDHTPGPEVAIAAVARGAAVIEKHLTLDRSLPGPDHRSSMEPAEFRSLVAAIRAVESALGDGLKGPAVSELPIRAVVRKVIVAARAMRAGEVVTPADVVLLRAPAGLPPSALPQVVGRPLKRDVARHSPITSDLV